jgi:hypothetical protein
MKFMKVSLRNYRIAILFFAFSLNHINSSRPAPLTVVLVVDQMRADFLDRFQPLFGNDGFNKLVYGGFHYRNAHFNYFPTYTGPGHACISTGSVPALNGIVANDWFDRNSGKKLYCVSDPDAQTVGSNSRYGKMSPKNLLATTIGHELRMTYPGSKSIALAIKDRAAILTAGHSADGAYWLCEETGNFISSSHYMEALPEWVTNFNNQKIWKNLLNQNWTLLRPREKYSMVWLPDNNPYEGRLPGAKESTFPYASSIWSGNQKPGYIKYLPYGNTFTFSFAKAAIQSEKLGQREQPDLLFISLSSTDILGHMYGIHSLELADMYARLDADLADFLLFLDQTVGADNWQFIVTADHAGAENHALLKHMGGNAGKIPSDWKKQLNEVCEKRFSVSPIWAFENMQVYLDTAKIKSWESAGGNTTELFSFITHWFMSQESVAHVINANLLYKASSHLPWLGMLAKGYLPVRSGDIFILHKPGWLEMDWQETGTTHGSTYAYDSHVPLLFYGIGVKKGLSYKRVGIEDIAVTLSAALRCPMPNAAIGEVLYEHFSN